MLSNKVDLAPDVSVADLELQKLNRELTKFETTNKLITKQNHLNGVVEQIHINAGKFNEQYHNFQNFGHALNPSDNSGASLVYSNSVKNMKLEANVDEGQT